jgi:hypothetical protein
VVTKAGQLCQVQCTNSVVFKTADHQCQVQHTDFVVVQTADKQFWVQCTDSILVKRADQQCWVHYTDFVVVKTADQQYWVHCIGCLWLLNLKWSSYLWRILLILPSKLSLCEQCPVNISVSNLVESEVCVCRKCRLLGQKLSNTHLNSVVQKKKKKNIYYFVWEVGVIVIWRWERLKNKSAKEERVLGVFDFHVMFSSICLGQNCNHTVVRFLLSL